MLTVTPRVDYGAFLWEKLQVFQQLLNWLVRGIGDWGLKDCFWICEDDSLLWFDICNMGRCCLECWGFCFEIWAFSACSICIVNCLSCWCPDRHATVSISNSVFHCAVGVYMCPISLRVFLLKHFRSQVYLLCWYLLFSGKQTRFLQGDGGSEIFLLPDSTTEDVFIIDQ